MYRQFRFDGSHDTLEHVIPARDYIPHACAGKSASPFKPLSLSRRCMLWVYDRVLRVFENTLCIQLYAKNEFRELIVFEPCTRNLLTQLLKKNIVSAWRTEPNIPELPHRYTISLTAAPMKLPSGRTASMQGSVGSGTGDSYTHALKKALAELLERHSLVTWDKHKLVYATHKDLPAERGVHPKMFSFFPKKDTDTEAVCDTEQKIHWIRAQAFDTQTPVYIPASLVFMFFGMEYPTEPVFWESTSNATAAGNTYKRAQLGAICEAIERDAFLLFWLNKIAPPRIAPESIQLSDVEDTIQKLRDRGIQCEILDCTTELQIPVFVMVCIDSAHPQPVHVHAAAGFNIDDVLRKICEDAIRFLHTYAERNSGDMEENSVHNFTDRKKYWSRQGVAERIHFFLEGPKTALIREQYIQTEGGVAEQLITLRTVFEAHNIRCYTVDITSHIATQAGLTVVKAVSPDLIPIYFDEMHPHTGVPRIYTALEKCGYTNTPRTASKLNTIPHPFL